MEIAAIVFAALIGMSCLFNGWPTFITINRYETPKKEKEEERSSH
jgi:hypothetical protein